MRASSSSSFSETFLPLSQYSPCEGVSRHPIRFISVDLPDPDGPIIATYSPRRTSNETPWSACTFSAPMSYVFQMFCMPIRTCTLPSADGRVGLTKTPVEVSGVAIAASVIFLLMLPLPLRGKARSFSLSGIRVSVSCGVTRLTLHLIADFQALQDPARSGDHFHT